MDDGVKVAEGGEAEDVADGSAAVVDAHVLLDAVDDVDGLFIAAAGHEHEEFVAAEPEDVVLAGDVREDVGNGLDQEIAARVAEGVVHLLEAVDIDEEDGVHGSRMQATGDEVRQGAAVADARELVDRADRVQLLDVVAVAHHDGGDAQDGVQRLGDGREAVFGRIDDGDVAERAVLDHELADGVALPLPLVEGLNLGVALLKR